MKVKFNLLIIFAIIFITGCNSSNSNSHNVKAKSGDQTLVVLNHIKFDKKEEFSSILFDEVMPAYYAYEDSSVEKNKLNGDWNIFIHKIPPPKNNLALLSAEINEELIALNEEFEVLVQIQNNGIETAKNALILLSINNINIGQKQLDLLPGEIKEEKFRTIINTNGEHIGAFEIIHDNYKNSLSYIFFWWWQ